MTFLKHFFPFKNPLAANPREIQNSWQEREIGHIQLKKGRHGRTILYTFCIHTYIALDPIYITKSVAASSEIYNQTRAKAKSYFWEAHE